MLQKLKNSYSKTAKKIFEEVQFLISSVGINLLQLIQIWLEDLIIIVILFLNLKQMNLGSQDTLIGGGRYDGLVKTIGGPDISGVGWASGIERIMMMLDKIDKIGTPLVQMITIDEQSLKYALNLLISLTKIKNKNKI